jgi:virginiamycin B lyase
MTRKISWAKAALRTLFAVTVAFVAPHRPASAQSFTEFATPAPHYQSPFAIAAGPDGALWFTELNFPTSVGRISTTGQVTSFVVNQGEVSLPAITAGPDNALWFVNQDGTIGRVSTAGAASIFLVGSSDIGLQNIVAGPDGALWFTEAGPDLSVFAPTASTIGNIGRITTAGAITHYPAGAQRSAPTGITVGPDGALWFTEAGCAKCPTIVPSKIGRITTSGVISEFALPAGHFAVRIVNGPDGALWFTESNGTAPVPYALGRITTTGTLTEFPVHFSPFAIVSGADGALWFSQTRPIGNVSNPPPGQIGRLTTSGVETDFAVPLNGYANDIAEGPDGAVWFTAFNDEIGRLGSTPTGPFAAAILPSSRSIPVTKTATAFATMINGGSTPATNCKVSATGIFFGYSFQTTDPSTNAPTGTADTPVTIPAGGSQSFTISLQGSGIGSPYGPIDVPFQFSCDNGAAAILPGVNTLLFSVSNTAPPDVVALGATTTNDGILHIAGTSGSAAFAVATVNVGAGGSITATANTGTATLPLSLSICQTNPVTAACLLPPAASATATINANETPTFSIFATANSAIPFSPGASRIFVRFNDGGGAVRGSTSVAVETQ